MFFKRKNTGNEKVDKMRRIQSFSIQITIIKLNFNLIIGFVCNKNNYLKGKFTMENLKLAIYESESNGDIDIDTRNILLSVLTETEAFDKANVFSSPERNDPKIKSIINDIKEAQKEIKAIDPELKNSNQKLFRIFTKVCNIWASLVQLGFGVSFVNSALGLNIKGMLLSILGICASKIGIYLSNEFLVAADINYANKCSEQLSRLITREKNEDIKERLISLKERLDVSISGAKDSLDVEKNAAKTALNKVKSKFESVEDLKLAIYEKELAGEITVEERQELISTLNDKILAE
jgi:hypothetical protein